MLKDHHLNNPSLSNVKDEILDSRKDIYHISSKLQECKSELAGIESKIDEARRKGSLDELEKIFARRLALESMIEFLKERLTSEIEKSHSVENDLVDTELRRLNSAAIQARMEAVEELKGILEKAIPLMLSAKISSGLRDVFRNSPMSDWFRENYNRFDEIAKGTKAGRLGQFNSDIKNIYNQLNLNQDVPAELRAILND